MNRKYLFIAIGVALYFSFGMAIWGSISVTLAVVAWEYGLVSKNMAQFLAHSLAYGPIWLMIAIALAQFFSFLKRQYDRDFPSNKSEAT